MENDQQTTAVQVSIEVQLTDAAGGVLGEGETVLEQRYLRPGDRAPYRVLFSEVDTSEIAGIVAGVTGGALVDTVNTVPITVENVEAAVEGRRYVLRADLTNPSDTPATAARAVLTVLDADGTVYGYRVWDAPAPLAPGDRRPLVLSVLPLGRNGAPPDDLTHLLHLEASPADTE